jgi:hypothetical protein
MIDTNDKAAVIAKIKQCRLFLAHAQAARDRAATTAEEMPVDAWGLIDILDAGLKRARARQEAIETEYRERWGELELEDA